VLILDMIEVLPPLGKYKYDTRRIPPVKCYIDNSVLLRSYIRNFNKHFWCRCWGGSQYLLSVYRLHRIILASIISLTDLSASLCLCVGFTGKILFGPEPPLLLEVYIEILLDRTSGSSHLTSLREVRPQKSEDELQETCG
jgi:hypothetical protein